MSHVPEYQVDDEVRHAAVKWQQAAQARINHLARVDFSFSTMNGMESSFDWQKEGVLRQEEDEAETEFVRVIDHFAMNHQPVALLSKSIMTNVLTISTLVIWSIVLVTSILPVTTTTNAGKRDLVETVLEIGEKCLGFAAATSKSYLWRVITFALFAGYAILKKGLEVHMDTAPERVACSRWSFVGALAAKALEHLAYAVRLTPASRAWNFCDNTKAWGARGLSVEQVARRRIWAVGYYKSELLAAHARNRRWRTMQ